MAQVYKLALAQLKRYDKVVYSYDKNSIQKTSYSVLPEKTTMVSIREVDVISLRDGLQTKLLSETPVVVESQQGDEVVMEIADGPDAGKKIKLANVNDVRDAFRVEEVTTEGTIQEAADELGLNGGAPSAEVSEDFPVIEK